MPGLSDDGRSRRFGGIRRVLAGVIGALLLLASPPLALPALADPVSPITLSVAAAPSPATSGTEITYTITGTNTGGAKLSNVVLSDQLNGIGTIQAPPATPQYVITSSKGTCTQSGQLVSCNLGTVNGGGSFTVTVRGVVTAPAGTTINNTASVTGTRSAQNFTTNATVQTLVLPGTSTSLPDLTLSKSAPTSVAAGSSFDYTLTVNNIGAVPATGIVVTDTLPTGVALTSVTTTSLFVCTPTSAAAPGPTTVTCTGGRVNDGQNGTITLRVTAPATAASLTNTASVDPADAIKESNEENNTSATVNTAVTAAAPPPSLAIVKTDDPSVIAGAGPDPVSPGQRLTYKVRVTNTSTTRADDVVVVDGTQGLEAASVVATQVVVNGTVGTGNGCTTTAPQVRCGIRSLQPGGTLTVTVTGTVIAPAGTVLINTATATGNVKNTGVTATATAQTTVKPQVDLTITKAGSPDPVCAASWPSGTPDVCVGGLHYTFVVGNSGITTATNVVVRDPLPAGTVYDSIVNAPGADFTCSVGGGNVLTCTNPAIGSESTETFTIVVVAPSATGPLTNTVSVDPANAIFEADETNNTASATVQVVTGVDLSIVKFDEPGADPLLNPPGTLVPDYPQPTQGVDPVATNGTVVYTIYVDNLGTQSTTDVRVQDTLPAGTKFLSATADAGFTCSHDGAALGGIVTCVGGSLLGTLAEFYDPAGAALPQGNQYATIVIKAFATNAVQPTMHNEVRVDPLNAIPEANEANNIATQDTLVGTGGAGENAFNQLILTKTQTSPAAGVAVATNGVATFNLHVVNDGTDPVSAVVMKDFLPSGSRFISAADTDAGPGTADAFFCTHDGSATGGTVTCTGGALSGTLNTIPESAGGGTVPTSRDVKVTIFAPNTPADYPNAAKVDPDNTVPEGNEFDNQSSVTLRVRTAGDGGQNSFNQLTITKAATITVATSSVITYTVTVANSGSDPAFGVVMRDVLPAGTAFISALDTVAGPNAFNCSAAAGVVTCTGATLSGTVVTASLAPTTRTVQIKAFSPTQPGTVTNTAFVDPDNAIPEGDETDNHASASTLVTVGAGYIDLQVSKCDTAAAPCDGNAVLMNQPDVYTVTATNAGTDPAFQVVLRDVLPAGATFVSAVDSTGGNGAFLCSENLGVVTCTGATLDGSLDLVPGVPNTRTVRITIIPPQQHALLITNQVFIDPYNQIAESDETNNQASDTSQVTSPFDLELNKEGPTTASQNSTEDYVITVTNKGAAVTDVVVVDALPVGLIPLSITATPGNFICDLTENPVNGVRCVGDMGATGAADDKVTITVHVFVTADGGTLDNEACVDPADTIVESDELNNCDTKSTVVKKLSPNISVQKTSDPASATIGQIVTYAVTVNNVGDAPADVSTVTLVDTLPDVVSFVGANATNGASCTPSGATNGGTVSCTPAVMTVGSSFTATIQVRVLATATGAFTNSATVAGPVAFDAGDALCAGTACENETAANTANNSDTVTTAFGGSAIDLVVGQITDTPDPAATGDQILYTVSVTNAGTQDALDSEGHQVRVRANLPTVGVTLGTVTATQGFVCSITNAGGTATCLGDLLSGQSVLLSIPIVAEATAPASLTVTVVADPLAVIPETSEANNSATQTTSVTHVACTACANLVMGQIVATPNPIPDNTDVTYQFVVTNTGDQPTLSHSVPAQKVVIAINLDTAFNESSLVSVASSNPDFTCVTNPAFPGVPAAPEILCSGDGLGAGLGLTVTVVAHADTAAVPSFVGFDVTVDATNVVTEFSEADNAGSLLVDTVAP